MALDQVAVVSVRDPHEPSEVGGSAGIECVPERCRCSPFSSILSFFGRSSNDDGGPDPLRTFCSHIFGRSLVLYKLLLLHNFLQLEYNFLADLLAVCKFANWRDLCETGSTEHPTICFTRLCYCNENRFVVSAPQPIFIPACKWLYAHTMAPNCLKSPAD